MDYKKLTKIADDLSNSQMQNIFGKGFDEEIDAGVDAERHEDLQGLIIKPFAPSMQCTMDQLVAHMKSLGFQYVGNDDDRESIKFENGEDEVEIYPEVYYPKMGKFKIYNVSVR